MNGLAKSNTLTDHLQHRYCRSANKSRRASVPDAAREALARKLTRVLSVWVQDNERREVVEFDSASEPKSSNQSQGWALLLRAYLTIFWHQ